MLGFIYLTGHNFSPFLRQGQINLSSLGCISQPFRKIRHSPSVGFLLRFIAWFINQIPEERVRGLESAMSSTESRTSSKPAFARKAQSPCEMPLLMQLPFHSSVWLILFCFSAPHACFVLWKVTAVHQATYQTCGLLIIDI